MTGLARRYVQRAAARGIALAALVLTGLLSLLQFVEELASVGQGTYGLAEAVAFVALTAPARLLQVMPVSMLLGSLVALAPLAREGELVAMLGMGIARGQVIGALLRLVVPITGLMLLAAEFVVPASQSLAQALRTASLASSPSFHRDDSLWAEGDHQYLHVRAFGRRHTATGVEILRFAPDGTLVDMLSAESADIGLDEHWVLHDVTRRTVRGDAIETGRAATLAWHAFLPRRRIRFLILPLDAVPPVELFEYVRRLGREDLGSSRYTRELWMRIATPASMLAMLLVAAPFVFEASRSRAAGSALARGIGVALAYSLGQQIFAHAGLLLDLSPVATALGPPAAVMLAAAWLLTRVPA